MNSIQRRKSRKFFQKVHLKKVVSSLSLFAILLWVSNATLVEAADVQVDLFPFDLSGTYVVNAGQQSGSGQFDNGGLTNYPEGACVPVVAEVENADVGTQDLVVSPVYDYFDDGLGILDIEQMTTTLIGNPVTSADDLDDFTYSLSSISATSFTTELGNVVTATAAGPFAGDDDGTTAPTPTDAQRHYNITIEDVVEGDVVYVIFCARLDVDAGNYGNNNGANMSLRVAQGGNENIAIQANDLLLLPELTVIKNVVNDEGGILSSSDFTINVTGTNVSDASFPGDGLGTTVTMDPGAYSVSEDPVAGYTGTFDAGCSGTLDYDQTATCIITNNDEAAAPTTGTITVEKIVVNDDAGTATETDFQYFVDATEVTEGVATVFDAGTYTISETGAAGYTATFSGACDPAGVLTLGVDEDLVCTITNDDNEPAPPTDGTIVVTKVVTNDNGGTALVSDFTLMVDATAVVSGAANIFAPNTYTISETGGPTGYTATFGGDTDCEDGSVTLDAGETINCTITNDDQASTLTVIKTVINDDGGIGTPSTFFMNVTGTNASPTFFAGSDVGTVVTLDAGAYSVSEMPFPTYVASYSADCSGTIGVGENRTCTVTNDDMEVIFPPMPVMVTVTKVVVNDDAGTSEVSDFDLFVDATSVESGMPTLLMPGTYTVTESGPGGYTGTFTGACDSNGVIVVPPMSAPLTCTLTNDDDDVVAPPTQSITINKVLIQDDGATDLLSNFEFFIDANEVTLGVATEVDPGTYNLREEWDVAPFGSPEVSDLYTVTFSGDCPDGVVTVDSDEDVVCTITNDDIEIVTQPTDESTITVTKVIVNDDGGVAEVSDFSFFVDATEVVEGVATVFDPGTYTVTETGATGYEAFFSGDCDENGSITLGSDEDLTCTITNADIGTPTPDDDDNGGGGGGGGGSRNNDDDDEPEEDVEEEEELPEPIVLGDTDEADPADPIEDPAPLVLGATDELPRTGVPATLFFIPALIAYAVINRKK